MNLQVSLAMTVLNEARSIDGFLTSLEAQTVRPGELVVVDGGSADGTELKVKEWARSTGIALQMHTLPGANISQGRNSAIRLCRHDLIAVTDAGTVLHRDWLCELLAALTEDTHVVSGFFSPSGSEPFQRMLAAAITPTEGEIEPRKFLPSSRSLLMRKEIWSHAGGYPEWLDYCEDLVFDLRLREIGARFAFQPRALVSWDARSSMPAYCKQYYRYARGDGKAALWPRRHALRYAAYITPAWLFWTRGSRIASATAIVGTALHLNRPFRRVRDRRQLFQARSEWFAAFLMVPVVTLLGDLSKMAGYPVGVYWRYRNPSTRRQKTSASLGRSPQK